MPRLRFSVGRTISREGPVVELKIDRSKIAAVLAVLLDRYAIADVSIHDPPLDQMIAKVFEQGGVTS